MDMHANTWTCTQTHLIYIQHYAMASLSGVFGYILALSTSFMDIEGLLVVYIADMAEQGGGGILLVVVWCVLLMIPFPVIPTTLYFFHTK